MLEIKKIKEKNDKNRNLFLVQGKIELRNYQIDISNQCINKNSLVVLPTGLGKTMIAGFIAAKTLEVSPPKSKIIMLAPTRPLINQHYATFLKILELPEENFTVLTGKVPPERRFILYREKRIIFYTPQTLRNDLVNRKYTIENVCLIIFDEAHHASGDYPYTLIADEYIDQNPDGNILALTASPGASKDKIVKLCQNLHIPIDNIHIRTRRDKDVKTYLKPMDIFKIGVDLTDLMEEIYRVLKILIEERLHYLFQLGFLEKKADFKSIIRKDLLKLNQNLINLLNEKKDKTDLYSALSINAQALILFHMVELLEQQGLDILLIYLEKLKNDAKKRTSSKAIKILATDPRLSQMFIELKRNDDLSPENLVHPKYLVLEKLITDELSDNPNSLILVFVKLRDSVKNIVNKLKIKEGIRPMRFVGQASRSEDDKGLTQKKQIAILEQFKTGDYNVLVSTNVGEEGLDIAECDMVIFYDIVASEIRLIQRKGRTARHREGKVFILYCKNTNDEIYLKIALNKLKKMNKNLKNPQELRTSIQNQRDLNITKIENNTVKKALENKHDKTHVSQTGYKRKKQSDLQEFIDGIDSKKSENALKHKSDIKISNLLAMKLGLRKQLDSEEILFETTDSNLHLILFNKIVVQIYNSEEFTENILDKFNGNLIRFISDIKEKYDLIIIIVEFIDFNEKFKGEKRLLKRNIQELATQYNIHLITIDNKEELFYVVKNIYEHNKNEVSSKKWK
ncbi:MAG: DEAD/DEAH box helicase [Promethearchaeota archaeon]